MRVGFKQPRDISQVFLTLASSPGGIERCPDFPLKNILKTGYRQGKSKDVAHSSPGKKRLVSRIGLNLYPQIGAGRRDFQTLGEPFNVELPIQQLLGLRELIHGNNHIEIKAYNGICICIDALSPKDAITDSPLV